MLDEAYKQILAATGQKLKPLGFRRKAGRFNKVYEGNSQIVEFQRSMTSTRYLIRFTINVAVVYGALRDEYWPPLAHIGAMYGHANLRIGSLLPERSDLWWELSGATDVEGLATEVANLVASRALPLLERLGVTENFIAALKSDEGLGATAGMRARYLKELLEYQKDHGR